MYRFFLILFLAFASISTAQPNVLLITIDTLRADYLGCYGNRAVHTPNLDALAAGSLFFENAVCAAPLTLVSHTSLLTGRYPFHHGIHDNAGVVPQNELTLAEILKSHGYHTYAFVGGFPLDHRFGLNQGFDVYDDVFPRDPNRPLDFRSERPANTVVDAVLNNRLSYPYFLWVHFYDPHAPYLHGGYQGEVEFVDQQIGRLLQKLNPSSTIIAVAGDHGESLGEHGEYTHRIFIYDSTMHVPFFIKGPNIPAERIQSQARLIDFLPTLLAYLNIDSPKSIDGAVLPKAAGAPALLESMFPQLELGWSAVRGVRTDQWKYIDTPHPELYDLRSDPSEKVNVVTQKPQIVQQLRAQIPQSEIRNPKSEISQEMREQLSSLGYVSGNSSAAQSSNIDPKDRIGVWNQIEQAVDLEKTKPEQSITILEKARKTDPTNPMVLGFLAQKYAESGKMQQARALLETVLASDPNNVLALNRMATVCLQSDDPASAIKWSNLLLKQDAADPNAYVLLARAYLRLNKLDEAKANLEAALKIDEKDYDLRIDLGNVYLQTSNTEMARKQFELALKTNPGNLQALNGLGTCAFLQNDFVQSEKYLNDAARISPNDPQTQMNLALLYSKTSRTQKAITIYREISQSPDAPADWKAEAAARLKELQP